jgi:AcrR family transcriptional regulator
VATRTDPILERRRAGLQLVQQQQLLDGFAVAVVDKGYAPATIADIVACAHLSKSTFYEHFADKEALYLHLHATVRTAVETAVGTALEDSAGGSLPDLTEAVVGAYLSTLASEPNWLAQVRIEPQVATPAAVSARVAARHALADRLAAALAPTQPAGALNNVVIRAGLAGTTAVVAEAAEDGPDAVRSLRSDLVELWLRLLTPAGETTT